MFGEVYAWFNEQLCEEDMMQACLRDGRAFGYAAAAAAAAFVVVAVSSIGCRQVQAA